MVCIFVICSWWQRNLSKRTVCCGVQNAKLVIQVAVRGVTQVGLDSCVCTTLYMASPAANQGLNAMLAWLCRKAGIAELS
jgi:hypothetical protein